MSTEKKTTHQFAQSAAPAVQPVDSLDCQYKSIGISAVTAAAFAIKGTKMKTPGEQMS